LINNRQNGRRRGRGGGQRPSNNVPSPGNRQDNRQRGNAAQLHEKYKALARDAQLAGDRVQTENYLQFADHYFRVLNEGRARFEEQRRQRDDFTDEDEDQDEAMQAGADGDDRDDDRASRDERSEADYRQRAERNERQREERNDRQRDERSDRPREARDERPREERAREDRPREDRAREDRNDRPRESQPRESQPRRARAAYQPRQEEQDEDGAEERISLEVLPPAIAADAEAPRAPRRRTRRPRPDGDAEIAPAA
jgi:hypothetical protein